MREEIVSPAAEAWVSAAYQLLTEQGIEAVKIQPLAMHLGVARTGFYWHFRDRDALLDQMIVLWEQKNTGGVIRRSEAYAENIVEAMFNLFDCWLDQSLFDAPLDLAIRNWARNEPELQIRVRRADTLRQQAISAMYRRYGYSDEQATARAMTVMYTQVGYFSMQIEESPEYRLERMPDYVEVYTGVKPDQLSIDRFMSRHRDRISTAPSAYCNPDAEP